MASIQKPQESGRACTPSQAHLLCAYVVDAYRKLGCEIASLAAGQRLLLTNALPRHKHLIVQLHNIMLHGGLLELRGDQLHLRTAKTLDSTPITTQYTKMLQRHPLYASEIKCLNLTGPHHADCVIGKKEPLALLFGNKHNLEMLLDSYANSPLCKAATRLLGKVVSSIFLATYSAAVYMHSIGVRIGRVDCGPQDLSWVTYICAIQTPVLQLWLGGVW